MMCSTMLPPCIVRTPCDELEQNLNLEQMLNLVITVNAKRNCDIFYKCVQFLAFTT